MFKYAYSLNTFVNVIRLFFAGWEFMNISSIRIIETNHNYKTTISALGRLDNFLSSKLGSFPATAGYGKELRELFNYSLNSKKVDSSMDDYIYDSFDRFVSHKEEIFLESTQMEEIKDEVFSKLVIYESMCKKEFESIQAIDYNEIIQRNQNDYTNLFHPQILKIFCNVKKLKIRTNSPCKPFNTYTISIIALLKIIKETSLNKVIVESFIVNGNSWLNVLWNENLFKNYKNEVMTFCDKCGFDIKFFRNMGWKYDLDILVLGRRGFNIDFCVRE